MLFSQITCYPADIFVSAGYLRTDDAECTGTLSDGVLTVTGSVVDAASMKQFADETAQIILTDSVETIGKAAFSNFKELRTVEMTEHVKRIETGAFQACTNLMKIDLHNVETIGESAFAGCIRLLDVRLSDSLTEIGEAAFCGCEGARILDIPSKITKIQPDTFRHCVGLLDVYLPDSVKEIGDHAFDDCNAAERVFILNPECIIGEDALPKNAVIYAPAKSKAHDYANANGLQFKALGGEEELPSETLPGTRPPEQTTTAVQTTTKQPVQTTTAIQTTTKQPVQTTTAVQTTTKKPAQTTTAVQTTTKQSVQTTTAVQTTTTAKPVQLTVEKVTAFPGDQNVAIRLIGKNTASVKSGGIQIRHAEELLPVYSDEEDGNVKSLYTTSRGAYESSELYNPKKHLIVLIPTGSFDSYTFYFDIPKGIQPGKYALTVNVDSLFDKQLCDLESKVQDGYIEVLSNVRGDANGDGIVTKEDAELTLREYTLRSANKDGILTQQGRLNADIDGDGFPTASDASAILYFLEKGYFPNEEPEQTTTVTTSTTKPTTTTTTTTTSTTKPTTTTTTTSTTKPTTTTTTMTSTTKPTTTTTTTTSTTKPTTTTTTTTSTTKPTTTTTTTTSTTKPTTTTTTTTSTTKPTTTTTTTTVMPKPQIKEVYPLTLHPTESRSFEPIDAVQIRNVQVSDNSVAMTALSADKRKLTILAMTSGSCEITVTLTSGDVYMYQVTVIGSGLTNLTTTTTTTTSTTTVTTVTQPATEPVTTTTTAVTGTPFRRGMDDWGFINSRKTLGVKNQEGYYLYRMDEADRDALLGKLTNSEAARIREELAKRNSGSCYGMAATALLQYHGLFRAGDLVPGTDCLAEITTANLNDRVCSVINYYQMLQFTKAISQKVRRTEQISDPEKLQELIDLMDSGKPAVLGYVYDGPADERLAHAVVAYGIRRLPSVLPLTDTDRFRYDTEILIYDNMSESDSIAHNMLINTKDWVWCIPNAENPKEYGKLAIMNRSAYRSGMINFICADTEMLNSYGMFTGSNSVPEFDYTRACMTVTPFRSIAHFGSIHPQKDGTFYGEGDEGDIELTASFFADDVPPEIKAVMDSDLGYFVAPETPDAMHVTMEYEVCLLHADADEASKVSVAPDGSIECAKSKGSYMLSMVLDEGHHATDWHTIRVSGTDGGTVRLKSAPEKKGWILQGDSLTDVTVTAEGLSSEAAVRFASYYDKVLIYQYDEKTIGIAVDADGDNTYETTIAKTGDLFAYRQGDTDGNGVIDVSDAQLTLTAYSETLAGNQNPLDMTQQKAADVDGNSEVNVEDAQYILNYYLLNQVSSIPTLWKNIIKN